jgi:hypothetical protein
MHATKEAASMYIPLLHFIEPEMQSEESHALFHESGTAIPKPATETVSPQSKASLPTSIEILPLSE